MSDKISSYIKLSPEAKVGMFVLAGIILLVYMSLRIGGMKFGRAEGYTLYVTFNTAAGLDKDAAVRIAGVEVGRVRDIQLKDSKAQLVLQIKPNVKVGKDFVAVLTTKGLLGERYLELVPGSPGAAVLKDGESVTRTTSYTDMDKLITILSDVATDIKGVTESLNKVLGGTEGENTLKNIVKNIEEITFRVNHMVADNDQKLGDIVKNLDDFTRLLKEDGPVISSDIKVAIKNLNEALVKTSGNLNDMISENRGNIKEGIENLKVAATKFQEAADTINKVTKDVGPNISDAVRSVDSIAKKIDSGQGTLGKLVNDSTIHDNLNKTIAGINNYIDKAESIHTYVGYRGEYISKQRSTKSYLSVRIQPKQDKFYLLEIVDDPRGKATKTTHDVTVNGATTTTEETVTSNSFKISAQIAKRFRDFSVRGGLIESTGGAGLDYYMFRDGLKISFEAFDFNKNRNPHLKAGASLYFKKFFYLTAGYDDFANTNKSMRSPYVGLGFTFDDEDLKYIMSSAPPVKF